MGWREGGGPGASVRRGRWRWCRRWRWRWRQGPRRATDGPLQLGGGPPHLLGDPGRVERGAHDAWRDHEHQLGLLDLLLLGAEEQAEHRNAAESGDSRPDVRAPGLDEASQAA